MIPLLLTIIKLAPVWGFSVLAFAAFEELGRRGRIQRHPCLSWLFAAAATGALFMLAAQILEATGLSAKGVLCCWLAADFCAAGALWRLLGPKQAAAEIFGAPRRAWSAAKGAPRTTFWIAAMGGTLLVCYGVFALSIPTTIWDSHTYHMPRVMHWIQQGSFAHYPSNIQRQIESSPGAEYQITQLYLLTGRDPAANLPQWASMLTCAVGAIFVALEFFGALLPRLDGGRRSLAAALAALLVLTIPDGVTQTFSSQNDLQSAAWTLAAVAFGWLALQSPGNLWNVAGMACALALATAVKPTAFIYLAPFGVVFLACLLRRKLWPLLARTALLCAGFMLLFNGHWMARNYAVFGHPLGSRDTFQAQRIAHPSPGKIAANTLRNLLIYARTPSETATGLLNDAVKAGLGLLHEDPADPDCMFGNLIFSQQNKAFIEEGDGLGNFFLPLFSIAALFVLAFPSRRRPAIWAYLGASIASFILFCGYLRWSPWHLRLHLAFWVMAAPAIAAAFSQVLSRRHLAGLAVLVWFNAALIACVNSTAPALLGLVGWKNEEEMLFVERPELYAPTCRLADDILARGCDNALLKISEDSWEYPLWVLLRHRGYTGRIDHAMVENDTRSLPSQAAYTPRTVLITSRVGARRFPDFPLAVYYGEWGKWAAKYNANFCGREYEERMVFVDNQFKIFLARGSKDVLSIQGTALDKSGAPLASNALRVIAGAVQFDAASSNASISFQCPVSIGVHEVVLSNAVGKQGVFAISDFRLQYSKPMTNSLDRPAPAREVRREDQ